jgi:hypothetical protein
MKQKLIEISPDNTKTGYECQKVWTNEWEKINHICLIKDKCGEQVHNILLKNMHYIWECEWQCLFDK